VFGSTITLLGREFSKFGVETTFVSQTDVEDWRRAIRPTTRLLFAESPTNPLTEVCDIRALAEVAREANALLAVDNCFCSPALQRPIEYGADLIIHSGTKYLDGQGRVIAGAVCGPEQLINDKFVPVMRSAGMTLSSFNAWVVLTGRETLSIRMQAQSERALKLATWLEKQPQIERVFYPGWSHLSTNWQCAVVGLRGAVSFVVRARAPGDAPRRVHAFHVIDSTWCARSPRTRRYQDDDHAPCKHLAWPPGGAAAGRRNHAGRSARGRPRGRPEVRLLRGLNSL
jgi:O-succinylhomoserine sulfhydrylase